MLFETFSRNFRVVYCSMTAHALPSPAASLFAARLPSSQRRWLVPNARVTEFRRATDVELVAQHVQGDPRAFAELVKRYTNAIYNVAYRFTQDAHEAENVTQETFLRAWNALPRLALDKPLKPYFVKIAVNLCRDWAEQKKLVLTQSLDADDEPAFPDDACDPLRAVSDAELYERVRAKLELLPPLYRTVIALRYTEEMSYEEIAAALDLPLNTVRTHLHRAKMKLRELLEIDE